MVVGMSYSLLNESARLMWEPNVSYSDKESLKRSETYMKDTWDGILRAGQIGSTSPDWEMYNKAEEIDKINQESINGESFFLQDYKDRSKRLK